MSTTHRLSADAQRTIDRTAGYRAEFEQQSTESLRLALSAYSKFVETAYSAEAAERSLEKIHAIECILHERLEAAAAMVEAADVAQLARLDAMMSEEAAPTAEPVKAASQPKAKPECRVRQMRAFYAACKSAQINTKNAEAMTAALAKYFGMVIPSRANLSAGHWAEAAAAVQLGILAW